LSVGSNVMRQITISDTAIVRTDTAQNLIKRLARTSWEMSKLFKRTRRGRHCEARCGLVLQPRGES
jgi:hypothetical protein